MNTINVIIDSLFYLGAPRTLLKDSFAPMGPTFKKITALKCKSGHKVGFPLSHADSSGETWQAWMFMKLVIVVLSCLFYLYRHKRLYSPYN